MRRKARSRKPPVRNALDHKTLSRDTFARHAMAMHDLSGRTCALATPTALALADRRFCRSLVRGTPYQAAIGHLAGMRMGLCSGTPPPALTLHRAGTGRPLDTICCRRPGNRRLVAVFGVHHILSIAPRMAASGRSKRFPECCWSKFTSAARVRQTLF